MWCKSASLDRYSAHAKPKLNRLAKTTPLGRSYLVRLLLGLPVHSNYHFNEKSLDHDAARPPPNQRDTIGRSGSLASVCVVRGESWLWASCFRAGSSPRMGRMNIKHHRDVRLYAAAAASAAISPVSPAVVAAKQLS